MRLIDADALIKALEQRSDQLMDEKESILSGTVLGAVCFVREAPTVDAVAVPGCEFCKGRYEKLQGTEFTKKGMIGCMDLHNGKLQINEKKPNGFAWDVIYEVMIAYCPMCGAKMGRC